MRVETWIYFKPKNADMKKLKIVIGLLAACALLAPSGILAQGQLNFEWYPEGPILTPRAFATACEFDEQIYVMGGAVSYLVTTPSMEMYDLGQNEWTPLENMPVSLCAAASAVVGDKIYVFGGKPSFGGAAYLNSVYVYDLSLGVWSLFPLPMPTPRAFHAACVIGDSAVYLIGGRNESAFSLASVEKFMPKDSSWTTIDNIATPRSHPTAKVLQGKIYAMAGIMEDGELASTVEILDPSSDGNQWETWPGIMPEGAKRLMQGSGVFMDAAIFIFGGINNINVPLPLFTIYQFNPETGFGLVEGFANPLPDTMIASASAVSGHYLVAIGGVLPPFLGVGSGPMTSERTWALDLGSAVIGQKTETIPVRLSQNVPNPFAAQTVIPYELIRSSNVCIQVFDLNGRAVATLFNGHQSAGEYSVTWDAAGIPAGIYFYRLQTNEGVLTKKCILQNH